MQTIKKEIEENAEITGERDYQSTDINTGHSEMSIGGFYEQLSEQGIEDEQSIGELNREKTEELQLNTRGVDFLNSLEKVKEKTDELIQTQIDLEDLYSDLDFHREEILTMTKKWLETQTELEEKNYAFHYLQNELKKLYRKSELHEKEINSLRKELQKSQTEDKKLQRVPPDQSVKVDTSKVSKDENVVGISQLLTFLGEIQHGLDSEYEKEVPPPKDDIRALKGDEVEKARAKLLTKQSELQQKSQEIDVIQADLEKKQEELETILRDSELQQTENVLLHKQIEKIDEEMESGEQTLNLFKAELDEIKTQLMNNPLQNLETDEVIGFLKNELQQKQEELEVRNDIIEKIRENKTPSDESVMHQDYKEEYYTLKKQFDQLDEEHLELKQAVEKLINEYDL